jgi:hypothetical protein
MRDIKVGDKVIITGGCFGSLKNFENTSHIVNNIIMNNGRKFYYMEDIPEQYDRIYASYWYTEELKLVEENLMTKDDLKTGMFVHLRNGNWYLYLKEVKNPINTIGLLLNVKGFGWMDINDYSNTLTYKTKTEWDIVEVAEVRGGCSEFHYILRDICNKIPVRKMEGFKVIWKREGYEKEMQVEELIKKLEGQLGEAKDELKKLRKGK